MNDEKTLKDKIEKTVGKKAVQENPFISSQTFIELMRGIAMLPKALLAGSRGPAEFVNALLSVHVTMLKNIPDAIWDALMEASKNQPDKNITKDLMGHLDALRRYAGNHYVSWHEVSANPTTEDDIPAYNVKPPTKPC